MTIDTRSTPIAEETPRMPSRRTKEGLHFWLLMGGMSIALVATLVLSVSVGAVPISFLHVANIIINHLSQ